MKLLKLFLGRIYAAFFYVTGQKKSFPVQERIVMLYRGYD